MKLSTICRSIALKFLPAVSLPMSPPPLDPVRLENGPQGSASSCYLCLFLTSFCPEFSLIPILHSSSPFSLLALCRFTFLKYIDQRSFWLKSLQWSPLKQSQCLRKLCGRKEKVPPQREGRQFLSSSLVGTRVTKDSLVRDEPGHFHNYPVKASFI